MNFAIVRYLIGWLMGIESLFLLLPAFTAVIYRETRAACLYRHRTDLYGRRRHSV